MSQLRRYSFLFLGTLCAMLAAGIAGILATLLLHAVEGIFTSLDDANRRWILPLAMLGAGIVAGLMWWFIRRSPLSNLKSAVASPEQDFPVRRNIVDAANQIFFVGAGASVGREVAPRQFATALIHRLTAWMALDTQDRRILMAAAAGAALGAVYNTPLAGAIYTLSIMLGTLRFLPLVISLVCSYGAVAISSVVHHNPSYYTFPGYTVSSREWIAVAILIVCGALAGQTFKWLCTRVKATTIPNKLLPITVGAVLALTGCAMLWTPDIAGNGVLIMQNGFDGKIGFTEFAILILLKPFFTLLTLRAGAVGGVLTPALALGGSLGGVVAYLMGSTDSLAVFMALGAAAVLSTSERSAWFGSFFVIELVGADPVLTVLLLCAGLGAHYGRLGVHRAVFRTFHQS